MSFVGSCNIQLLFDDSCGAPRAVVGGGESDGTAGSGSSHIPCFVYQQNVETEYVTAL